MNSVSIIQAAMILGCSRRSIYNWIKQGKLQTISVSGSRRVLVSSLEEFAGPRSQSAIEALKKSST